MVDVIMEKETYDIVTKEGRKKVWHKMPGYVFMYKGLIFGVSNKYISCKDPLTYDTNGCWTVTEISSGLSVGTCDKRKDAPSVVAEKFEAIKEVLARMEA